MAVQATSEQKIAYAAMLKSTAIASIELKAFIEQLGKRTTHQKLRVTIRRSRMQSKRRGR